MLSTERHPFFVRLYKNNDPMIKIALQTVTSLVLICLMMQVSMAQKSRSELFDGVILDEQSKQPISKAHILVMSTTIKAVSKSNGHFELSIENMLGEELVISHVGYQLYAAVISDKWPDTFYLDKKNVKLGVVSISAKHSNLKEKRLKVFKETLFGGGAKGRKMKLHNPEAILFEEINDTLYAYADDLLLFTNKYLDYNLQLKLERYNYADDRTVYRGKVFYEDLSGEKIRKRIKRRRAKAKLSSQELFFRSLLKQEIDSYKIFTRSTNKNIEILNPIFDLHSKVYKTLSDHIFALVYNDEMHIAYQDNISSIKARNGVVLFDINGVVLNIDELELKGHWAVSSLADVMPITYKDKVALSEVDLNLPIYSATNFETSENVKNNIKPLIEEIIIETDRLLYNQGEEVLVATYLFDHRTREYLKADELVYIELVHPNKMVLDRKVKLARDGRVSTGFILPDSIENGQYIIRAYTDYMGNFSEDMYSHKVIGVGMMNRIERSAYDNDSSCIVQLFPEGDNIVLDQNNRILFTVQNKNKQDIEFEGVLTDTITGFNYTLKTLFPGHGILTVRPSQNSNFVATRMDDATSCDILFNNNNNAEASLGVFVKDTNYWSFEIVGNSEEQKYSIGFWKRGLNIYNVNNVSTKRSYRISRGQLPSDYIRATLMDKDNQVVSTRYIDNRYLHKPEINFDHDYSFKYTNQKTKIRIVPDSFSSDFYKNLKWTIKVTHTDYDRIDRRSFEYKNNDVIDLSNSILPVSKKNRRYLNNLVSISSKLAIEQQEAYKMHINRILIKQINKQRIEGQVTDIEEKTGTEAKLTIASLSDPFLLEEFYTDPNGYFEFNDIPYSSLPNFVVQAHAGELKKDQFEKNNRDVDININSNYYSDDLSEKDFNYLDYLIPIDSIRSFEDYSLDSTLLHEKIEEVVIKTKKLKRRKGFGMIDIEEYDWIPKTASSLDVFRIIYPRLVIQRDLSNFGQLRMRKRNIYGDLVFVDMQVIINGEVEFNFARFESLVADQIKYMSIFRNIVIVVTNPGFSRRSVTNKKNLSLKVVSFIENIETIMNNEREVNRSNDLRKTIYWKTDAVLSDQHTIDFMTSSIPGNYNLSLSTIHPEFGYLSYVDQFEVKQRPE